MQQYEEMNAKDVADVLAKMNEKLKTLQQTVDYHERQNAADKKESESRKDVFKYILIAVAGGIIMLFFQEFWTSYKNRVPPEQVKTDTSLTSFHERIAAMSEIITAKLDAIKSTIDTRLDALESQMRTINQDMKNTATKEELQQLENKMNQRFDAMQKNR